MQLPHVTAETSEIAQAILGYLNFSAGTSDTQFLGHLNSLYRTLADTNDSGASGKSAGGNAIDDVDDPPPPLWDRVTQFLLLHLENLQATNEAFRDTAQARAALTATRQQVLPAYLEFHRDLLFHQDEATLFGPFFVGRVFECVLRHTSAAGLDDENLTDSVLAMLNDFVGHRPVAALETEQKIEPYSHERCRPVPVYIRGAGVAFGPYEQLVTQTLRLLESIDEHLLASAQFDFDHLEELALDPRPYDFDHPVNKRPNYQFGTWDPDRVDNRGFYTRFVVQQVTVDSLLTRVDSGADRTEEESLYEAAAALAGTVLMASGICGGGPDAYSSEVTLNTLLPTVASYRDAFYEQLINRDDAVRLRKEAQKLHQPFGGVRQHLNAELARRRAGQMEHVHLAKLFAKMGYPDAAARQSAMVPAASARITCMIECLLTDADHALDDGDVDTADASLQECVELVHRGIECGAIVDPWNILGFDANFSLYPAPENSVHDHRIDELIDLMDRVFALFARTLCLSAAANQDDLCRSVANRFDQLAGWWDQFAVTAVSSVDGVAAGPLYQAATAAGQALAAWQSVGVQAGDIRFWQPYAEQFQSPKAYVLVINALLDKGDFVASMSLLMHWLSQSEQVDLQEGSDLFHVVAMRWLDEVLHSDGQAQPKLNGERWGLVAKFFDFLEANAGSYWEVPQLELDGMAIAEVELETDVDEEGDEEDEDDLYSAAYDGMSYRDSTDDGIDSQLKGDAFGQTDYEFEFEARRISDRLSFLVTVTRLWKRTVLAVARAGPDSEGAEPLRERFNQWLSQTLTCREQILNLMHVVAGNTIPQPTLLPDSLVEYDRQRIMQEALIDRIIASRIAHTETAQFLIAGGAESPSDIDDDQLTVTPDVIRAVFNSDVDELRTQMKRFVECLSTQSLLYVPLNKNGDPLAIVKARSWQRSLRFLLSVLPRLGMLKETFDLMEKCAEFERDQHVGPGAVTEFDQIFRVGNQGMVDCLVACSQSWPSKRQDAAERNEEEADHELIEYLQQLVETVMQQWLDHSQTLRLSVLEKVNNTKKWSRLKEFIQQQGHALFDQTFLNLGNLRGILHRGVVAWLDDMAEAFEEEEMPLLTAVRDKEARRPLLDQLQIVIEAVVENYIEYRDYNGTTTQSDRGEMLYTLLDMLRVRIGYDRVAWNLIPAAQAHEVLVRNRRTAAAETWRSEMVHRTEETSDEMLRRLKDLQNQYGMRLTTIADRVGERFIRPLEIDRVKVLVQPAMEEAHSGDRTTIDELQRLIDELTREPTGVGLDLPHWLEMLEDEVERVRGFRLHRDMHEEIARFFPQQTLSRHDLQTALDAM